MKEECTDAATASQTAEHIQLSRYERSACVRDIFLGARCTSTNDQTVHSRLAEQLSRGEIDPTQDLIIGVWRYRGCLICRDDNHKLRTLIHHPRNHPEDTVVVHIDVVELGPVIEKFASAYTSRDSGQRVFVRQGQLGLKRQFNSLSVGSSG